MVAAAAVEEVEAVEVVGTVNSEKVDVGVESIVSVAGNAEGLGAVGRERAPQVDVPENPNGDVGGHAFQRDPQRAGCEAQAV